MNQFSKACPGCNKKFSHLEKFMEHVKKAHSDIPPDEFVKIGKEHKSGLKDSDT